MAEEKRLKSPAKDVVPVRTIRSMVSHNGKTFNPGDEEALFAERPDEETIIFLLGQGAIVGDWKQVPASSA